MFLKINTILQKNNIEILICVDTFLHPECAVALGCPQIDVESRPSILSLFPTLHDFSHILPTLSLLVRGQRLVGVVNIIPASISIFTLFLSAC